MRRPASAAAASGFFMRAAGAGRWRRDDDPAPQAGSPERTPRAQRGAVQVDVDLLRIRPTLADWLNPAA